LGDIGARHRARDFFALERQDLLRAMRSDPCDLIHAHWTYEFALAALDSGFPVLVTAHDAPLPILRYNLSPYRALRALMAYRVVRRTAHMTVVSPYLADHYVNSMRYRGRLAIIPNALADEVFSFARAARHAHPAGQLTFASALAGWGGRKNGHVLLQAFAIVRKRLPEARLLMFGQDHGSGEAAELWAQQKGLTAGVHFAGHTPYFRLLQTLREEVDVLVHPSLEESFGMVLAECMALGLTVIAGERGGGTRYVLEEGKAGLLADIRAPHKLATAMLSLADADTRRRYAEAGARSARRRFQMGQMVSAFEEQYRNLLTGRWQAAAFTPSYAD
jgi:glycosyltransferase involved in cell wall biosynthesis